MYSVQCILVYLGGAVLVAVADPDGDEGNDLPAHLQAVHPHHQHTWDHTAEVKLSHCQLWTIY